MKTFTAFVILSYLVTTRAQEGSSLLSQNEKRKKIKNTKDRKWTIFFEEKSIIFSSVFKAEKGSILQNDGYLNYDTIMF